MKAIKRIAIWLAAMIVIVLIVNIGGSVIVYKMGVYQLSRSLQGYSRKAERMIHPSMDSEDEKERIRSSASLAVRTVLSDDRLINEPKFIYNFVFANFKVDITNKFFDKDGLNELSSGVFACAYQEDDDASSSSISYMKKTFGVIDINEFCKLDCASDIYNVLETEPEVVVRLNSYTISNYIVNPVSITLLDENENELLNVECPYEGDLIKKPNCYILNEQEDKETNSNSIYYKMRNAYLGERKTDRIANKLVNDVNFDKGDYDETKTSYGLGIMTIKHIEVIDGYAEIYVLSCNFVKGVVFYTVIFGGIMSLIMLIVIKIKSH